MVATCGEAPRASDGKEPREKARPSENHRRGTGRRRIPLERIEKLQARRVCFAKRRQGLFRKCMELCRLFPGYQIAAVAFSPDVGTPFEFAGPSASASPADLFCKLLLDRMPPPVLSPPADVPEDSPALVSAGGPVTKPLDVVSSDPSAAAASSASSFLDDVQMQTLMVEEEEKTEMEAALSWVDSILQDDDEADDAAAA